MSRLPAEYAFTANELAATSCGPDRDLLWQVHVFDMLVARWTKRAEADEHARRINAALEWDGKENEGR